MKITAGCLISPLATLTCTFQPVSPPITGHFIYESVEPPGPALQLLTFDPPANRSRKRPAGGRKRAGEYVTFWHAASPRPFPQDRQSKAPYFCTVISRLLFRLGVANVKLIKGVTSGEGVCREKEGRCVKRGNNICESFVIYWFPTSNHVRRHSPDIQNCRCAAAAAGINKEVNRKTN